MMITCQTLPDGYLVHQAEDLRWYPMRVERCFAPSYPEAGHLFVSPITDLSGNDLSYLCQEEAIQTCMKEASQEQRWKQQYWQALVLNSHLYPERCAHYRDIIQEATGAPPKVHRSQSCILIWVEASYCPVCFAYRPAFLIENTQTIEDALNEAAQRAYAEQGACGCSLDHQQQARLNAA